MSLRQPRTPQPGLHRFFQGATWLWDGIFLMLAACLAVLMVTRPVPVFLTLSTVATVALIVAGIGVSAWWLRSVLRRTGLGFRFAPT